MRRAQPINSGDELDGPRGRIYLIKELFEEQANEVRATVHLDRCLTCRACETTCPSGVSYGELAELARDELGAHRGGSNGIVRRLLQWLVPHAARLRTILPPGPTGENRCYRRPWRRPCRSE